MEDKKLLLKDLCARLPYGVKILDLPYKDFEGNRILTVERFKEYKIEQIKPYLHPMSSMTEEEKIEYCDLQDMFLNSSQYPVTNAFEIFDWLNAHHFDYRGLIEKGLALEAPTDMYSTE